MKQSEYRIIIFALCYFHATIVERKKFGVGNLPRATSGRSSSALSSTVLIKCAPSHFFYKALMKYSISHIPLKTTLSRCHNWQF